MAWFKVDDTFPFNPKVMECPVEAIGLWVLAGAWSCQQLTDGFIPEHVLPVLRSKPEFASHLLRVGLWKQTDGGYQFHDWDDYQPSAAKWKDIRQKRAEAGRKGGIRSGEARREANAEAKTKQALKQTRTPTRPDPTRLELPNGSSKRGAKRAHPIPANWKPTRSHHELAANLGVNCDLEADKMRDWALSKGQTGKDWDARFRNWLRRAAETNPPRDGDRFDDWDRARNALAINPELRAIEGGTR